MADRVSTKLCGKYLGDNDATCPQLTCIRRRGHEGLCDNVRGDDEPVADRVPPERPTDETLRRIEALAKRALAGRWFKDDSPPPPHADDAVEAEADAASRLITALDPVTVLGIVAHCRALAEENERLRTFVTKHSLDLCEHVGPGEGAPCGYCDSCDARALLSRARPNAENNL